MARPHRFKEAEMADFIDDDIELVDSQASFAPNYSSPLPTTAPRSAQRPNKNLQNSTSNQRRVARPVILSSSVVAESDVARDETVPSQTRIQDLRISALRPTRKAADSAYSPIRKHARMDLGYISDIAECDDSDDPDELDADSSQYAPFETQVQDELDDAAWEEVPECEDIGLLTENVNVSSGKFVELGLTIEEDSYFPTIEAALAAENESGSKFGVFLFGEKDYWQAMSLTTLCSMPQRAVKELMCGNLKQAYNDDSELREMLDEFQRRGKQHPCIYARTLTMPDGTLMTVEETKRLARWLQRYISVSPGIVENPTCKEAFRRIDHQFRAQWKRVNPESERAYLASNTQARVQSRVDNVTVFCQRLIARCEASEKEGTPLKPLTYIGYAARADRRKRQHEACGTSSNWLATLVQAVCNILWGQGHFQMHFMVVCLLTNEFQGMISEMLLTRIAGAYYNVGSGFCIDVAGKSMESLYFTKLTHHQNIDRWIELADWVVQFTPLETSRFECLRIRREKRRQRTAALVAKNEAIEAELMPKLLKHSLWSTICTSALDKYKDDPAIKGNLELHRLVAEYARDFAELGKAFRQDNP